MGQDRVAVKRPHREDKDVGLNPAATEIRTLGDPSTEGSPMVQQGLSGDQQHKAKLDPYKNQ